MGTEDQLNYRSINFTRQQQMNFFVVFCLYCTLEGTARYAAEGLFGLRPILFWPSVKALSYGESIKSSQIIQNITNK